MNVDSFTTLVGKLTRPLLTNATFINNTINTTYYLEQEYLQYEFRLKKSRKLHMLGL